MKEEEDKIEPNPEEPEEIVNHKHDHQKTDIDSIYYLVFRISIDVFLFITNLCVLYSLVTNYVAYKNAKYMWFLGVIVGWIWIYYVWKRAYYYRYIKSNLYMWDSIWIAGILALLSGIIIS
jgi:hypothetical protein